MKPSRILAAVLVCLFIASGMPNWQAAATATASTTIDFHDAVCDGNVLVPAPTGPSDGMSCILDIRTTGSGSAFDVALAFAWTDGGGPAGVAATFTIPTVSCPTSSGAACGSSRIEVMPSALTYAPDTQTFRITATRLCGGAPCSPLDQGILDSSVVFLRKSTLDAFCAPDPVPIDSLAVCTARVVDAGADGPASTPVTPGQVMWTEMLLQANQQRLPSGFSSYCNLIAQATPNTAECDHSHYIGQPYLNGPYIVDVFWPGDADHAPSRDVVTVTMRARTVTMTLSCPASVYLGQGVTCTVDAQDTEIGNPSSPTGDVWVLSPTTGSGLFTTADLACTLVPTTDAAPSSCFFTFYPWSAGLKSITTNMSAHLPRDGASATVGVDVLRRATTTSFVCSPDVAPVQAATSCVAEVIDTTSYGVPVGTVGVSVDPVLGAFDASSCTLATVAAHTARCVVSFTPSVAALDVPVALSASYAGDTYFGASGAAESVTGAKRGTTTDITCTADILIPLVGTAPNATCTAVVADNAPGAALVPTGNVSWTSVVPESFTDAVDRGNCTLDAAPPYDCGIGAALPLGDQMLTATYAGDATHTGSAGADLVHVHAATAIAYAGDRAVVPNGSFTARALLHSQAALCSRDRAADPFGVSFHLDRDPQTGAAGAHLLSAGAYGTVGTNATGAAALVVTTENWTPGLYTIDASYAGDPYCDASWATARILVGTPAESAYGAGKLSDLTSNFTFRIQKQSKGPPYSGQFDYSSGASWRLKGELTSLVRTSTNGIVTCAADGVGELSYGLPVNGGVQWVSLGSVRFGATFDDAGPNSKKPGDRWGVEVGHVFLAPEPAFPAGTPRALASGNVVCR